MPLQHPNSQNINYHTCTIYSVKQKKKITIPHPIFLKIVSVVCKTVMEGCTTKCWIWLPVEWGQEYSKESKFMLYIHFYSLHL